jgi:heme exporter protein A
MNMPVEGLTVEGVHVWRGDRHVLKGLSLTLAPRQLLHVRGPNGSGKTTLLRVACGLLRPERGEVRWGREPILKVRLEYQAMLAYASHEPALKGDLTAMENLRFAAGLKRRLNGEDLKASLERTGVLSCADLPVRVLSAGQRRRVAMARVLAMSAALWLLDEPFTNLDAAGVELMSALLGAHIEQGGAALVVAHQTLSVGGDSRSLDLGP